MKKSQRGITFSYYSCSLNKKICKRLEMKIKKYEKNPTELKADLLI